MTPSCQFCRFYKGESDGGECRRYPPQVVSEAVSERHGSDGEYSWEIVSSRDAYWPDVMPDQWCGEYEKDPRDDNLEPLDEPSVGDIIRAREAAPFDPISNIVCVSCKCGNLPKIETLDLFIKSHRMVCPCGQRSPLYDTPARALEMWNAGHREGAE